jgi:hypothetical protein
MWQLHIVASKLFAPQANVTITGQISLDKFFGAFFFAMYECVLQCFSLAYVTKGQIQYSIKYIYFFIFYN